MASRQNHSILSIALCVSVLAHDLTHATDGIPLYPAFDDAFHQGEIIIAPESLRVCKHLTSSNPGHAIYACGGSKIGYWFGHLDRAHALGKRFRKGAEIYVEGQLQTRKWTDNAGVERYTTEIIANQMQILSDKGGDRAGGGTHEPPVYDRDGQRMPEGDGQPQGGYDDDSIPF